MVSTGGMWLAVALATTGASAPSDRARDVLSDRTFQQGLPASEQARRILSQGGAAAEGSGPPAGCAGPRKGAPSGKDGYQTDLPGSPAPPSSAGAPPRGRSPYQTELPHAKTAPSIPLSLGPLAQLLRILGWTGLAILAALLAVWLGRLLHGLWSRRRGRDAEVLDTVRRPGPVAIPVGDAEALAAQGSYAEAVHALLLRTLEALSRAARLSPALTSREIVARVPLAPRARLALRGLVHAVEISRFGGAEPGEAEYRACRERFQEFLTTYGTPA